MIFISSVRLRFIASNLAKQCKNTIKFNKIPSKNLFQLAIDGPAASGKSYYFLNYIQFKWFLLISYFLTKKTLSGSTARIAAQRLKFEYIDSGNN